MEKNCETCGSTFNVKPYLANEKRHCSQACKDAANKVSFTCPGCGSAFFVYRSQLARRGNTPHCSKKCADEAKRKPKPPKRIRERVFKVCEECGKTFRVPPVRKETARFCSIACKASNVEFRQRCSDAQPTKNTGRWVGDSYLTNGGYVRVRRKRKDGDTVRWEHTNVMLDWLTEAAPQHAFLVMVDGFTRLHPDVEIHHIDRDRSNNVRENLLAVTRNAHAQIHRRGRKPEPWECWPPNPEKW